MVIRAATGSAALQLMSDCCARGETNTAQLRWQRHCLTLCLVFALLCSSECEAEVFCVPAELLLHPASLLSVI